MRSSWNRASADLDFEIEELNKLIAPAFPLSKVDQWHRAEGGLANTNIRLHLSDREEPILLRLFVRAPEQASKEWQINQLVHQVVPSPEFWYFANSNPFTKHPYILMEWIDAIRMEDVILNLQTSEVEQLGQSVGSALAAIHSFRFDEAGFFDTELRVTNTIDVGGNGLITYAEYCLGDGIAKERLGSSLTERVLQFLKSEARLLDEWQGAPCLTHSDYGGSNILVRQEAGDWKLAAVLDWEFAFSGTPFFDFGNLLRAPHGTVPRFEASLVEGYQLAGGQLPAEWRKMSLLTDLTAWIDFMTRKDPGESLINDARRIISQTIENWAGKTI